MLDSGLILKPWKPDLHQKQFLRVTGSKKKQELMEEACRIMVRRRNKLEKVRNQLRKDATASHNALYRL